MVEGSGHLYSQRQLPTDTREHTSSKTGYTFETTSLDAVQSIFHPLVMFGEFTPLHRVEYKYKCVPRLLGVDALRRVAVRVAGEVRSKRTTARGESVFKSRRLLISVIERTLIYNALCDGETYDLVHIVRGVIAAPPSGDSREQKFRVFMQRKCGGTQFSVRISFFTAGKQAVREGDGGIIWLPINTDQ